MVPMVGGHKIKSGAIDSAFSQVPVVSYSKGAIHSPPVMDTSTSSNSVNVSSPDRIPNFTVRANNGNTNGNTSLEKQNFRVRQNCDQGYRPPLPTAENHLVVHATSPRRNNSSHNGSSSRAPPLESRGAKNEMPFDVLNHMIIRDRSLDHVIKGPSHAPNHPSQPKSPPRTRRTTGGNSAWEEGASINELDPERGRFTIPPFKISNPTNIPKKMEDPVITIRKASSRDQATIVEASREPTPASTPSHTHHRQLPVSPGATSTAMATPVIQNTSLDVEALTVQSDDEEAKRPHAEDDSSLFDFEEEVKPQFPEPQQKQVKVTHKMRRRNRMNRKSSQKEVDDAPEDTSIESPTPVYKKPSPTTLQERAAQAWKARRAAAAKTAKTSSLRQKDSPSNKSSTVSFGESDTIHHFEPEPEETVSEMETLEDDEGTLTSVDGRSLNSEYTKGLESEVEDMIKDILFIGSGKSSVPGRRKIKHKPEVKRKLRKKRDPASENKEKDNGSLVPETSISSTIPAPKAQVKVYPDGSHNHRGIASQSSNVAVRGSKSRDADSATATKGSSSLQADGDPFVAMWGIVEGGVAAVSSALGLDETPAKSKKKGSPPSKKSNNQSTNKRDNSARGVQGGNCADLLFGGQCMGTAEQSSAANPPMEEMVDYAEDLWYGELHGGSGSGSFDNFSSNSKSQEDDGDEAKKGFPFDPDSMDRDPRLIYLALQAAKSFHHQKGLQYDESIPVDMVKDVKMSIVELKLPLGLIFLENEGGCFVTKVSPNGSAARSGGVEVGDQLACINGIVGMSLRVGDICKIIPRGVTKIVELGLLRYVGPLRPANRNSSWDSYDVLEANESLKDSFEGQEVLARAPKNPEKRSKGKRKFRLFGRGKKRS